MNVAAIVVTRGDQDLWPCVEPLQNSEAFSEVLVWDNGAKEIKKCVRDGEEWIVTTGFGAQDLAVYGRYAAIEYTDADLIYVQDDDCVVSDPQAVVDAWLEAGKYPFDGRGSPWGSDPRDFVDHIVCNMPPEFRHEFYEEHALVGFGACFHRDAPARAFQRASWWPGSLSDDMGFFYRTCDIVFTALTPRVLVDVPKENLPYAYHETRMWKQPEHQAERVRMLDLVRQIA